mmetsp:Transcript_52672/g.171237  ORF Transcript_52672/g.171237 Transcript_52672/m.171237 type:complete len:266 (-) Transcript_52672:2470-3267(-)
MHLSVSLRTLQAVEATAQSAPRVALLGGAQEGEAVHASDPLHGGGRGEPGAGADGRLLRRALEGVQGDAGARAGRRFEHSHVATVGSHGRGYGRHRLQSQHPGLSEVPRGRKACPHAEAERRQPHARGHEHAARAVGSEGRLEEAALGDGVAVAVAAVAAVGAGVGSAGVDGAGESAVASAGAVAALAAQVLLSLRTSEAVLSRHGAIGPAAEARAAGRVVVAVSVAVALLFVRVAEDDDESGRAGPGGGCGVGGGSCRGGRGCA